ncbi:MAG: XdhC family protein [Candidatus Aminicenantes bacterium]|nr:XdhC family protein [Candidatus Aminicenantes bacterium]
MIDIYEKIAALKKGGGQGVLVTVVEKEGHGPAPVQAKMLFLSDGEKVGTVGGGALEHAAEKTARKVLKDKKGLLKKYLLDPDSQVIEGEEQTGMLCGGTTTLFYEYIGSGLPLYIFGAGHIGRALVRQFEDVDYHITILDNREEVARQVSGAQHTLVGSYNTIMENREVEEGSFFVIATHSHALDYVVLKRIYEAGWKPAYIGMVASRKKGRAMKEKLIEELGREPDFSILYCPVGLDIGGPAPAEIALSIAAEMQALRYDKKGHKHYRDK